METDETDTETELTGNQTGTESVGNRSEATVAGGLEENVAGALTYLFGFVTGFIFYLIEDDNEFVRFHAAQSIIVFGGLLVLSFAITFMQIFLEMMPAIGWIMSLTLGIFSTLLGPIAFILWIVLLVKAYKGQRYGLPIAGDMAEGWV